MGATGPLEAQALAVPVLVVTDPAELHGRSISLVARVLSIGRAAGNDFQLDDPFLSGRHALVRRAGGEIMIEDIGSSSGVVVNEDLAIGPTVLRAGDRVRLGLVELELRSGTALAAYWPGPGLDFKRT